MDLDPDMSFCAAGRAVLGAHFYRLLASEPGTLRGESAGAIHDMRVATGRLRAAVRDFRPAFGKRALESFGWDVQWLGNLLGRIRDLDVFIAWLEDYDQHVDTGAHPYLLRVIQDRKNVRARERAALITGLGSERYHHFTHVFSDFIRDTEEGQRCRKGTLVELAEDKIMQQQERVRKAAKQADSKHLKRLHRLRIQVKRLRYTAEFFSSLFPGMLERLIQRAKDVQDALGTVHDADLQIQFLKEVQRVHAADVRMCSVLDRIIDDLGSEQDRAFARFRKTYRRLGKQLRRV